MTSEPSPNADSPPRAFTQGVGTVFQFLGVILFLLMMFICCGSGLLSKEKAQRHDLTAIGWTLPAGGEGVFYSAQRAVSLSVTLGVFFGIALAGLGLGLQAQHRLAPAGAVVVTLFASLFWAVHLVFFVQILHSAVLGVLVFVLLAVFLVLSGLSVAALREMRRNPPPRGHEILPPDYKAPYSHMHQDPPEVRLARELDSRRQRLAVQQKELELLEKRLQRKLDEQKESES